MASRRSKRETDHAQTESDMNQKSLRHLLHPKAEPTWLQRFLIQGAMGEVKRVLR